MRLALISLFFLSFYSCHATSRGQKHATAPRPKSAAQAAPKAPPADKTSRIYDIQLLPEAIEGDIVKSYLAPSQADSATFALYRNGIRHVQELDFTVTVSGDRTLIVPVVANLWRSNERITLDYNLK